MVKYIAILIEGDNENSLGGACARDVWNISKKIINELPIGFNDIHLFFHDLNDKIISRIKQLGINNIKNNSLQNIKDCFDKIISMKEKIILIFHYSGHGYQTRDTDGDEIDGQDEVFLGHQMTDDYIWNNLISKLPETTHIFASIDACHSGSGMDFPYLWKDGKWNLVGKKFAKCSGFSISACNDSQLASQDVGETTGFSGSLTAGICDSGNYSKFIDNPFILYDQLVQRLKKLNQNVELYRL